MSTFYNQLLADSWKQSLRNKILWIIGIFISGISFFMTYDSNSDIVTKLVRDGEWGAMFSALFENIPGLIFLIFSFFLLITLSLISLVSKAALINGVSLSKEKKTGFVQNVKFGVSKIVPMLLLEIFLIVPNLIMFVLVLIAVKLNTYSGLILTLELLMLIYSLFILLFTHFAYCEITLKNKKPWEALKSAWTLFFKHWKKTLLVNLLRLVVGVGFWLANAVVLIIVALPFALLAFISIVVGLAPIALIFLILGAVCLFVSLFLVKGFMTTYIYVMMTRLYWSLDR